MEILELENKTDFIPSNLAEMDGVNLYSKNLQKKPLSVIMTLGMESTAVILSGSIATINVTERFPNAAAATILIENKQTKINEFIGISSINIARALWNNDTFINSRVLEIPSEKHLISTDVSINHTIFLTRITELELKGNRYINETLDYVFSSIDDLLFDQKYSEVEKIFNLINMNDSSPLVLISLLTATDVWKTKIRGRKEFYKKVSDVVKKKYDRKKANELLFGLE